MGQFFCGACAYPMMIQTYIYLYECCEDTLRQKATVAINYSWCITYSLIGVLYYYYNYWYDYLLYVSIIPMVTVFIWSFFYLVEGPNYLYRKHKIEECKQSLKIIARVNGTLKKYEEVADSIKFEENDKEEKLTVRQSLKLLLNSKLYIRMMLILFITESGANTYYWGNNYAYDQVGYEYGLNCIIAGIIEGFGFFTLCKSTAS
jgi:hypothetical protein